MKGFLYRGLAGGGVVQFEHRARHLGLEAPAASSSAAIGPFIDSAVDKFFCCPANSAQCTKYFNNNNNSKHNVDPRLGWVRLG